MATSLKELEAQSLQLPQSERVKLMHRLLESLDGSPEDSPAVIARARLDEIARRVADMDAGRTQWIPADEAIARVRARLVRSNGR